MSRLLVHRGAVAAAAIAVALPLAAQQPVTGYAPAGAQRERAAESDVIGRPAAASAREHLRILSQEPHVAGTPAQARTRDYVISQMKSWGLQTEVREYDIWMPHPTVAKVWRTTPNQKELPLAEPPIPGDSAASLPQYPTVNGYSGTGDVTGDVVYVNYGLIEDYTQLAAAGVSVRGKVAIARYGRSFRGIKAREAEKNGAIALLIYSDPADDGYVRGDVYPDGPWRPPFGVQRGSVFNGAGDPSTPGYPSTPGAKRIPLNEMVVPRIPVIPIGYGNAAELLRDVRGARLPVEAWQGGLDFRYHVGPGPARARVVVQSDTATNAFKKIWNTYGFVRGTEFPDEMVLIGGHRDGWGPGAGDNVSGVTAILEAAHAVADAVKAGYKPKRTIVFATWDAEEWGLIGSSEYAEDDSLRLSRGAVAYYNLDGAASGALFGGGGSPSLRPMLRDVARVVPDPSGNGSVYALWRKNAKLASDTLEPAMGDPGGGSDYAGFYNHLGIPMLEWGFGGTGGGVYHSQYDSFSWMARFGDSTFAYHAAAGRIGAALLFRLGNADILPYDYVELAKTMRRYYGPIDKGFQAKQWSGSTSALAAAVDRLEAAGRAWASARDAALAAELPKATRERTNRALLAVEKALIRSEGLVGRPWYRNLIYVADIDNGYANMVFPSVNEAIRVGNEQLARQELDDLARRFEMAALRIDEARAALGSR